MSRAGVIARVAAGALLLLALAGCASSSIGQGGSGSSEREEWGAHRSNPTMEYRPGGSW